MLLLCVCYTVLHIQNVELDRSLAAYDQDYIYGTSDVTYAGLTHHDDVDTSKNNNDEEQNNTDEQQNNNDTGNNNSELGNDEQQQVQRVEQEEEVEVESDDVSGDVDTGDSPLKVRTSIFVRHSLCVAVLSKGLVHVLMVCEQQYTERMRTIVAYYVCTGTHMWSCYHNYTATTSSTASAVAGHVAHAAASSAAAQYCQLSSLAY
jgi:hypothetical protein